MRSFHKDQMGYQFKLLLEMIENSTLKYALSIGFTM